MAREFVRFVGTSFVGKKPTDPTGSGLIPVDPVPEPQPSTQPRLMNPTILTRDQLVAQYGEAVGEAMHQVVLTERRKSAEKFRAMHTRLSEIRAQIASKQADAEPQLQDLQRAADDAYSNYLTASCEIDAARARVQGEVAALANEAEEIVRALNVPLHSGQVRQWTPTVDERRPAGSEI